MRREVLSEQLVIGNCWLQMTSRQSAHPARGSRLSSAVFLIFLINSLSLPLCCIDYCVKTQASNFLN
jgi:hypothetical protein